MKDIRLNLQGQGGFKRIRVDFKRFLAEAIIPFDGAQPSTRLRRDGALPCKVVIIFTHALPRHPKRVSYGETSKKLSTLNSQLKCAVSGVGASENPMKLKQKEETYWSHKYP